MFSLANKNSKPYNDLSELLFEIVRSFVQEFLSTNVLEDRANGCGDGEYEVRIYDSRVIKVSHRISPSKKYVFYNGKI